MTAAPPIVRSQRFGLTGLRLALPASAVLAVAVRRVPAGEFRNAP
jgi:hypothetical protein